MTMTERTIPTEQAPPPSGSPPPFETCDQCQAPLDARQRYCVICGTHRSGADDPVARYLAAARRARSTPPPSPQPARTAGGARLAAAIALVPVAAALGVLVGRGDTSDQQLVNALKVQKAPVVTVVPGGTTAGAPGTTAATGGTGSSKAGGSGPESAASSAKGGEVIARTQYGTARKLEGSKPSAGQVAESKKAIKKIIESKGKAYVESQRGLPDQIVIP